MQPCQPQHSPTIGLSPQPVAYRAEVASVAPVRAQAPRPLAFPFALQRTLGAGDDARWFALNGGRIFCVQTLTGMFPDTGWHLAGEMGGLWSPPIKLFDGYWLGLRIPGDSAERDQAVVGDGRPTRASTGDADAAITWLTQPDAWELTTEGAIHRYTLPALGLAITRCAWIVPDTSALVLDVWLTALADARPLGVVHTVECGLVARSELLGSWRAEERPGPGDTDDVGAYDASLGAIALTNTQRPERTACMGAVGLTPVAHAVGPTVWGPQRT